LDEGKPGREIGKALTCRGAEEEKAIAWRISDFAAEGKKTLTYKSGRKRPKGQALTNEPQVCVWGAKP